VSAYSGVLEAQKTFRRAFGYTPTHVVKAPARLELLGNHTDYNEGLVLSLAVDRYLYLAASPRNDGRIELFSAAFPDQHEKFWISEFTKTPTAPWTDYVKGVLAALRKRRVHFAGFNAAVFSEIPLGAGMGSSGALEVATAIMLRELYPYRLGPGGAISPPRRDSRGRLPRLTPKEKLLLAQACGEAETEFVGVKCGLLDQISSLCGKEFHAMQIDFKHLTVEWLPLIGEIAVVVFNSGVKHAHATGHYNARRFWCDAAAKVLRAKSLRSVEPRQLGAQKSNLREREHGCAYHVVGENQRVVFAGRALDEGDLVQLGQYLFQSHESSRDFFQNSCAELDLLVELARAHPGCLGARLTGGGFGGATINLVAWNDAEDFMKRVAAGYEAATGRKLAPMRCRIVDGAG